MIFWSSAPGRYAVSPCSSLESDPSHRARPRHRRRDMSDAPGNQRALSTWRNTRLRCDCGGYAWPHRRTGGACIHGPRSAYYLALRNGATRSQAEAEMWADKLDTLPP